jgi:GABA permease
MSYVSPGTVFAFLVQSYGTVAFFVYVLVAISRLHSRRSFERENPERLTVMVWACPYLTYFTILGMLLIPAAVAFFPDQRSPLLFGLVSLAVLLLAYLPRLLRGQKAAMWANDSVYSEL